MATAAEDATVFHWPVRVYYEDTDAGGLVYHARYLHFFERARTEWLRALGFEQDRLRDAHGVLFAVRRLAIEYLRPARFNDALTVTSRLAARGGASLDFAQEIIAADGTPLCRADVAVACIDAVRVRPARIPAPILAALAAVDPVR